MTETTKLPVLKAVLHSWSFASVAWLPTLPVFVVRALIMGFFFSTVLVAPETGGNFGLIGFLLMFLAEIACVTVALRLAVRGEYDGFFGIQVSGDEGRLLIAQLMYMALIWFVVLISGFIIFTLAGAYLSTTIPDIAAVQEDEQAFLKAVLDAFSSPVGIVIATLLALAFFFPVIFMTARLVTFPAATIARKKILVFETFAWTRSHEFRIVLALIAALAPFFLIYQLGNLLISSSLGMNIGLFATEDDLMGIGKLQWFIFGTLAGLLSMPINLVSAGLSAYLYKGFNPDRTD